MNKTITWALILFFLIISIALGVKMFMPQLIGDKQKLTSDAVRIKGKIRIDLDNWIGYFHFFSPELKKLMHKAGYVLVCNDDNANYPRRMKRLQKGEIDLAVATVDSYILNAANLNFPGTIVMVIDESKGGDAILARKNKITSFDELKGKSGVKVAFTPNSPSHHLLKAASDHFSVQELLPSKKYVVHTDGSKEACKALLNDKVDIAVCWEPDVSKTLDSKKIIKLLGTEDTRRLIVDILVVNRDFMQNNSDAVYKLMNNYFRVLKLYKDNHNLLVNHVKEKTNLNKKTIKAMLKGVHWVNFNENCVNWFGIAKDGTRADEGLVDTIESSVAILKNSGDFKKNPIPDRDAYRLLNSSYLEEISKKGISGFTTPKPSDMAVGTINSLDTRFSTLEDKNWDRLVEVGTLKIEPVIFQRGSSELDLLAQKVIDSAVDRLKHYPNFRVLIKAHTGTRGDQKENFNLSQKRAQAVDNYLARLYNIDANRTRAVGFGGTKPLKKKPDESQRSWMYRLPRVEIVLVKEDY